MIQKILVIGGTGMLGEPAARQLQAFLPIWAARWIARLGKRQELQSVLPFFEYCEKIKISLSGSPDCGNRLCLIVFAQVLDIASKHWYKPAQFNIV